MNRKARRTMNNSEEGNSVRAWIIIRKLRIGYLNKNVVIFSYEIFENVILSSKINRRGWLLKKRFKTDFFLLKIRLFD